MSSKEQCNLFVAGIPGDMNDDAFKALFASFGQIISAKVMRDLSTGASRHYGFVLYAQKEHAEVAIKAAHGVKVGNDPATRSQLFVTLATHDDAQNSAECERLYVRNIPDWLTADGLQKVFEEHGKVVEVSVLPDPARPQFNKGVGFVRFSTVDEARKAIENTQNATPWGPDHALLVRFMESNQMRQNRQMRRTSGKRDSLNTSGSAPTSPHSGSGATLSHSQLLATSGQLNGSNILFSPQASAFLPAAVMLGATPALIGSTSSLNGSGSELRLGNSQQLASSLGAATIPIMLPAPKSPTISPNSSSEVKSSQILVRRKQPPGLASPQSPPTPTSKAGPGLSSILPGSPAAATTTGPGLSSILPPGVRPASNPTAPVLIAPIPFPTPGDLFFQGVSDEQFLQQLVAPWGDVRMIAQVGGGFAVRLSDMTQHVTVAQTLNAATLPSGTVLIAAVIA